ncbi:hypothetical protein [Nocardia veterana]|uniref:Uncharacterized protein n=1 Tax=Nocardia veterana TaxID=132249 RepID=A0A7X6M0X0_9NOCA|nr:hypothetical protein [Nocardia veterana]NKY88157.1 hypothetical protein [Nocardia veterana]
MHQHLQPGQAPQPSAGSATPWQMPRSVRAARIIIFAMAAIGLVGTVVLIASGDPFAAGGNTTGYFFFWVLAVLACFFGSGRGGVRAAATTFAILEMLMALGSSGFNSGAADSRSGGGEFFIRLSPGPIGVIVAIVVIVLLYQRSAAAWFGRPRAPRR